MTKKQEREIIELAMKLRVKPQVIRAVCLRRKITPKQAARIIESNINKVREQQFEW